MLVDDRDLQDYKLRDLRRQMAFVGQDCSLFDMSVKDNLKYTAPKATDAEIRQSLLLTDIYDFVMSMPHKLDSPVGEDGKILSFGQRQRLSISRAFLSKAPIIIFDEPTSALDAVSEAIVRRSIADMVRVHNRTVIMITHRKSTIKNADVFIMIKNGQITQKFAKKSVKC